MSLVINNNIPALNVANSLSRHYSALQTSTRRLSSGLRVGAAADDAAGLAIRELMRADITAMKQGVRNANDAISLIQTADGALGIIDEKLIRMKELAEQAATGTYDSTQRLMIDSEYQAMASEITRIANATVFNGIHLLNGKLESGYHDGKEMTSTGKLKVHFGPNNNSAEDYYYIQIDDMTAEGLSIGHAGTVEVATEKLMRKFTLNLEERLKPKIDSGEITQEEYDDVIAEVMRSVDVWTRAPRYGFATDTDFMNAFEQTFGSMAEFPRSEGFKGPEGFTYAWLEGMDDITTGNAGTYADLHASYNALGGDEKQKYQYAFLRQAVENMGTALANGSIFTMTSPGRMDIEEALRDDVARAGVATTQWFIDRHTYAGQNIRTQENAQHALDAISQAIITKDKIRASLGASQNRLENTVSNITIQAENLQAAVSMLAQANSLPRMALNLIG